MRERKSLRPQGLARTTAEGARGCAWRAAGRRCRGCRHADVSRHRTQPYRTVPYHTVSYLTAGTIRQSISYPVSLKESQGERKPLWETGKNVENSVESVWKTCFKALRPLRAGAGAAGSLMGTFGRVWSGGGAAVDRSGARGRGCGGADAGSGGGRVRSGARFRPVRVRWTLLAGALWRPCGAGRGCSAGRAGWLSCREKKCLTSYAKAY